MKRFLMAAIVLSLLCAFGVRRATAQVCSVSVRMVNHNRYAYDTAEECFGVPVVGHSVPFGNWGVSSNVGSKRDADQFQGWHPSCNPGSGTLVEWNSCSVDYVKPDADCLRLNFPDPSGVYPYPANGYPFTDSYPHNNYVPIAGGTDHCVDQYSPCGPNLYGVAGVSVGVSPIQDYDGDGYGDAGGCADLDGAQVIVQQNFMTVYELDGVETADVIDSLYFQDVTVTLRCFAEGCWAVGDYYGGDGWIDDIGNQFSPEYKYPFLYQNNHGQISYATDPGVPAKRIDATIRIGGVTGYYYGPRPCSSADEEACRASGGRWVPEDCSCRERCNECA